MKKYFKLALSFLFISFYGCDKQIEDLSISESVYVEKGILTFDSEASFLNTLKHLKGFSDNEINLWLDTIGFSNSHFLLQSYYDQLPTEEDITLEEKLEEENILFIPSPAFSAIINQEGIYKIGSEFHRITEDIEYISKDYQALLGSDIKKKSTSKVQLFYLKKYDNASLEQKLNLNGQTLCAKYLENSYTGTGFYGGNYFNKYHPYPDDFFTCGGGIYSFHTQTWYIAYSNYFSVGTWIKGRKYKRKGLSTKWRDDTMSFAKINNTSATNVTRHTVYFNEPKELYVPAIQTFRIVYQYNDEGKGLRQVNMTFQSIP